MGLIRRSITGINRGILERGLPPWCYMTSMRMMAFEVRDQKLRQLHALVLLLAILALGAGCASMHSRHPVPVHLVTEAQVPGFANVRTWGDDYDPAFQKRVIEALRKHHASSPGDSDV